MMETTVVRARRIQGLLINAHVDTVAHADRANSDLSVLVEFTRVARADCSSDTTVAEDDMGPLTGLKVVELGGIGPVPFAGMVLADMGADVIRVSAPGAVPLQESSLSVTYRGRRSIGIDLKHPAGRRVALNLLATADAVIEGFRPGVLERLGLSPEVCWEKNPRLVVGRMTGWGQQGPLVDRAGHDINYIAMSGALHSIGRAGEAPIIPLNLLADYGGGGWPLAFGVVAGIFEAGISGHGQVLDVAMLDGAALLMTPWYGELSKGRFKDGREQNRIDGAAHFYNVYETADGCYLSVGALEPQFFSRLVVLLGLDEELVAEQDEEQTWDRYRKLFAERFATESLAYWVDLLGAEDVCVTPVLSMTDAPQHPHARQRGTFVEINGIVQAEATPRFSRTSGAAKPLPRRTGEHTNAILRELAYDHDEIRQLREQHAVQ